MALSEDIELVNASDTSQKNIEIITMTELIPRGTKDPQGNCGRKTVPPEAGIEENRTEVAPSLVPSSHEAFTLSSKRRRMEKASHDNAPITLLLLLPTPYDSDMTRRDHPIPGLRFF